MKYEILAHERRVMDTLDELPDPERENKIKIIREKMVENPFPGEGRGDIKKVRNSGLYRLHIGREHTVFYKIDDNKKEVKIWDLVTIEEAHKIYGEIDRI